jgi:D-glycero-alpha-D-manno-heptose-7-phosphate kinase
MILSRAPLRVSLAGGGSDLPAFYEQEPGEVLSFSIDKYVYIAAHELFKGGIRLSYSRTEEVDNPNQIEHPLIRETFLETNFMQSIEVGSFADVPGTGTGLGSSSAFTVALLNSLSHLNGMYSSCSDIPKYLADTACKIEIERCGQLIGKQDQFASAYGGVNHIKFNPDGSTEVESLLGDESLTDFLNESLALFYLGFGRPGSEILNEQSTKLKNKTNEFQSMLELRNLVPEMKIALTRRDRNYLGHLLTRGWQLKASTSSSISSPQIDRAFSEALELGALGGKVVGAGGGGFFLLALEPQKREAFIDNFSKYRNLPFGISRTGAEIIYSD